MQKRVWLLSGDMRRLDLKRKFKLVTMPFRPLQHLLTVDDQLACLIRIYRHLKPGGRLVFDVFNPDIRRLADPAFEQETGGEPPFEMPDGRRVERKHRRTNLDQRRQVFQAEIIYYVSHPNRREERVVHAFPFRYFFRYELEHLLVRVGFEVEALYGGFDRSPYGFSYPGELIFVARKP